jgi:hypothetical protein
MLHPLFHVHIVCDKEIIELLSSCVIQSEHGTKTVAWEVITRTSPNENKPNTVPTACKMWELSSKMLKEV